MIPSVVLKWIPQSWKRGKMLRRTLLFWSTRQENFWRVSGRSKDLHPPVLPSPSAFLPSTLESFIFYPAKPSLMSSFLSTKPFSILWTKYLLP
jgi:hypothetical protein